MKKPQGPAGCLSALFLTLAVKSRAFMAPGREVNEGGHASRKQSAYGVQILRRRHHHHQLRSIPVVVVPCACRLVVSCWSPNRVSVRCNFSSQTGERDVPWSGVLRLPNCLAARSIGDLTRPQQHELRGAWMDRVIFEMFGDAQTFFFYSSGYMVDVRSGAPPAMIGR